MSPASFPLLTTQNLTGHLAAIPAARTVLTGDPVQWQVSEISDGNMNAVFRVTDASGTSLIAKQAPPYIRVIGPDWPFPPERIDFEHAALTLHNRHCPTHVPAIIAHVPELHLLLMEDLRTLVIARKAFIQGMELPHFAGHMARFLAETLFHTSDFALPTVEKKALMARFAGNAELCATTEAVIFTGPYWSAPRNHWNPVLADLVREMHADRALHRAAARLHWRFRSATEALIHGDLHTGSIMVGPDDTRVIDAEWAFHGPMGFDLGALFGNLLIASIAHPCHGDGDNDDAARQAYAAWLRGLIGDIWHGFSQRMTQLALEQRDQRDDALLSHRLFDTDSIPDTVDSLLRQVLSDATGFAGAKMIRRVIGISHVEDLATIPHPAQRGTAEWQVLQLARRLVRVHEQVTDIDRFMTVIAAPLAPDYFSPGIPPELQPHR